MRVLVACEFSGVVRDAFIRAGHDAMSCDLEETERPGPHFKGDVREVLRDGWNLIVAHPPCDYLANSGVRWRVERGEWAEVRAAAAFFRLFLEGGFAPRVAVENPVMHGRAGIRKPDFTRQPWQFGDNVKKRTCFWTVGLEPLRPTSGLDGSTAQALVHREPPGPERKRNRSRFFPGMASAMADQWG